ncbi:anti-sigma factor [Paramicrobacterium agarici]|uniref:anti-sigma factor n=1 Tax=Paramicrobacterium agarici TaxID=630514 RepID=UPI001153DB0A|nr:anti-sigma factor [Microbacterium agarici]TQO23069.1 anti-sigma-K factor rskA [Microbacterium agarici]
MTHDKDADAAAAHALDALPNDERAQHERALEHDNELQAEQASFDSVARELGEATTPVAPPSDMKARLMASIADLPQQTPAASVDTPADAETDEPAQERTPQHDSHTDAVARTTLPTRAEQRAQRRWYTRPAAIAVAAVAASALIFAGGATVGSLVTGNSVTAQSEAADKLAAINAADDVQRTSIEANGTTATIVWSAALELSAVVMDGLPDAPEGKVYEAWYIDDAGAVPAGTFAADAHDTTWHVLDGEFAPGTVIGITIEPEGGSEQPTSDPIMVFETA